MRGIKSMLNLRPCWEILECPNERRDSCVVMTDPRIPCWKQANWACPEAKDGLCHDCKVYQEHTTAAQA